MTKELYAIMKKAPCCPFCGCKGATESDGKGNALAFVCGADRPKPACKTWRVEIAAPESTAGEAASAPWGGLEAGIVTERESGR